MGPDTWLHAVDAIKSRNPPQVLIPALKTLKTGIVGHPLRKELAVREGVLEPLKTLIAEYGPLTHDTEQVAYQATVILGSLASGGPEYVAPIVAAGVPSALLRNLSSYCDTPNLLTPTLTALRNLARSWVDATDMADLDWFNSTTNDAFKVILKRPLTTPLHIQHLELVAGIIAIGAKSGSSRTALVRDFVLETLAGVLAASVASEENPESAAACTSPPPLPRSSLATVLAAICSIVDGSICRAYCFFLSRHFSELARASEAPGTSTRQKSSLRAWSRRSTIPFVPEDSSKPTAFPAQLSLLPHLRPQFGQSIVIATPRADNSDKAESVCCLLNAVARNSPVSTRFICVELMAHIFNAVTPDTMFTMPRTDWYKKYKERESHMALLAVPIAVHLVQVASMHPGDADLAVTREEACHALARLIGESSIMQARAVEAGAIRPVCALLQQSFEAVPLVSSLWVADKISPPEPGTPSTCVLGARGLPAEVRHAMKCRVGALYAVAALAANHEKHRRELADAGVMPLVVQSLKPFGPETLEKLSLGLGHLTPADGNTVDVIIAGCRAAQMLARSVSALRTTVTDANITTPIVELLHHNDIRVKIASTRVCINLLLEFSPLRDDLLHIGAFERLINHAHSDSSQLRIASIWALQHLASSAGQHLKVNLLELLMIKWLQDIISKPLVPVLEDDYYFDSDKIDYTLEHIEEQSHVATQRDDMATLNHCLCLFRNLIGNKSDECIFMIRHLYNSFGEQRLLGILTEKLSPIPLSSSYEDPVYYPQEIVHSTIQLISHLATGDHSQKKLLVCNTDLINACKPHFTHPEPIVRASCAWIVLNLLALPPSSPSSDVSNSAAMSAREIALRLRELGIEEALKRLRGDLVRDVVERASQAMELFNKVV